MHDPHRRGARDGLRGHLIGAHAPDADLHGVDALVFRATAMDGQSAEATVTITGTPVNDAPTISTLADQSIHLGAAASTGELAFAVDDVDDDAEALVVTATSSNVELVPNDPSSLVLAGTGVDRTFEVIPAKGAKGMPAFGWSLPASCATSRQRAASDSRTRSTA